MWKLLSILGKFMKFYIRIKYVNYEFCVYYIIYVIGYMLKDFFKFYGLFIGKERNGGGLVMG